MIQRTLVLVKPDGVRRGLTGEILSRLQKPGLKLISLKMVTADRELAGKHYTYEDIGAKWGDEVRNRLLDYLVVGPVVATVFEGSSCIEVVRKIAGATEPRLAAPGTIRGDYCHHSFQHCTAAGKAVQNVIHASSNEEDAKREIALWFKEDEIHSSYTQADEKEHFLL